MVIAMMMVMLIVAVLVVVSNVIFPVIYITACNNAMKSSVERTQKLYCCNGQHKKGEDWTGKVVAFWLGLALFPDCGIMIAIVLNNIMMIVLNM